MEFEDNAPNFEIEKESEFKYGNETGNPPLIVVVQGGKNSGKSTLIRSLVKYYTNQNVNIIRGSITIRNSKNQRITFYECINDISTMIDLSKIADVALIMIDSSVGFEMETFEFMSLLKNHGFTSVMGVLTHMDQFRQNKSLNKLKKQIKKRFLKEATDKAKLFYLFGIKNHMYLKLQMHNIARYLRVIKPSIPGFRQNHPYILSDRFEINFLRNSEDPEQDVFVSFFGYIRGNNFSKNSMIHINGLGDYNIDYITKIEDPCPIETIEVKGKKKRTLKQKEKFLYAPYCNINNLEYDRNEGYINIPDRFVSFTKGINEDKNNMMDEGVRMVRKLQDMEKGINTQLNDDIELFDGIDDERDYNSNYNSELDKESDEIDENEYVSEHEEIIKNRNPKNSKIKDIIDRYELKSKPIFYKESATSDMTKTIYDTTDETEDNIPDTYKYIKEPEFDLDFLIKNVKKRFLAGSSIVDDNEAELSGSESDEKNKKPLDSNENEEDIENKVVKHEKKEEINHVKDFCNEEYGLYEKGLYVRIDIKKIKKKYVDFFKPDYPIIICATNIQENSYGFLKIKFTKHLWHPKILKTNDPIILSIGWRKFQTVPIYCIEEKNHKMRMIKYTPKYGSCYAITYGPLLPINVSIVAIQNYSNNVQHFRISGTGDLVEINQNFEVNKKLKLIGEPYEIFKKTAFVKGMFNSNLEVARYLGARIQTVSGIRGQIKKAINKPEGCFRATFEDKILKSDIVFLKTWNPIDIKKFYNPILNYGSMKLLRTMGQLRKDYNLSLPQNPDSEYKPIHREERVFPNLAISKNLEKALPFKSKNKIKSLINGKPVTYQEDDTFLLKKLNLPHKKPLKNYHTESEKSIYSMLQRLQTIKNIKDKKSKQVGKEIDDKKKQEEEKMERLKRKRTREKMGKMKKNKK